MYRKLREGPLIAATVTVACAAVCICLGVLAHLFSERSHRETREIATNWFPSVQAIGRIRSTAYALRRVEIRAVLSHRGCDGVSCRAPLIQARQEMEKAEAAYVPLISEPDEHLLYQSYQFQKQDYLRSQDGVLDASDRQGDAENRFLSNSQPLFDQMVDSLNQLSDLNSRGGSAANRRAEDAYDRVVLTLDGLTALLLLGAGAMLVTLFRLSARPDGLAGGR